MAYFICILLFLAYYFCFLSFIRVVSFSVMPCVVHSFRTLSGQGLNAIVSFPELSTPTFYTWVR